MRRWILSICVLLVVLCLTLAGLGHWLLRTTDGAAWLIDAVANAVDVQITTGQLDGRLADELVIEKLAVAWPNSQLTAQRIQLDWQPLNLFEKKLKVRVLEVDQLVIQTTAGAGVTGATEVDANESPFAASDLAFLPAWLTVEIDRLEVQGVALQDGESVVVVADEISGRYLWSRPQLNASSFVYRSPSVHLRGSFDWDLLQPHLDMSAEVHLPDTLVEPQLFKEIAVPVDFPAHIKLDGDWNGFSGPVRFGKVAEGDDTVWLTAETHGSWQGLRFDNLQGRYLNGSLAGDLDLAWIDSYRMSGELACSGLDPGVLVENLDGQTRLDVSGELLVPYDDRPLQASLGAVIHEGRLRGHAIAGTLAADWQDGDLNKIDLDLTGDGARVIARGKPSERLELDLDVADLGPFYPGLTGRLTASGWLRWAGDYLTGEARGSGANLAWQETSIDSFNFNGRHLAQKAPLALELDGQGVRYADLQADHLQLGVSGTLEKHDVQVAVKSLAGDLALQLAGQYRDEVWQAELQTLSAQTPILGTWHLEEPALVMWRSGTASLEDVSLSSRRREHVTLKISEWGSSTNAQLVLTWHDLSHGWLAYLRPSYEASGKSSGELSLVMAGQQPVSLQASLSADARLQNDLSEVTVSALTAEAAWHKDGLLLTVAAESDAGEHLEVSAHSSQPPSWRWPPDQLSLDMRWQGVDLERISRFRKDLEAEGRSDGSAQLEIRNGQLQRLSARISADGLMQQKEQPVGFRSLLAELSWDDKSFQCSAHIEGAHEGILDLKLSSTDAPRFAWPDSGQVSFKIDKLYLQSLNPLLPPGLALKGVVRGTSDGYWQRDGQIFLDGQVHFADSTLMLHSTGGQVDIQASQADLEWRWQGDHLTGSVALRLANEGQLQGRWQLPLPARWPTRFVADGALQGSLQGQLHASGMLAALAPGLIQDLHGLVKSDLQVSGTWLNPVLSGQIALHDAGAYLPATGVTIEDFEIRAALKGEQIKVEEFSLRSGPGTLSGAGVVNFDNWRLERYQLDVEGERLQVYNFPELQVLCSPELTLTGNLESFQLDGSVLIPQMSLLGSATAPEVLPSSDAVISGETQRRRKALPIDADIRVAVELGDQVRVKTAGVETRLQGGGMVAIDEQDNLAIWGEISLAEGVYKAYGANLGIKQGVLKYTGGPVENPSLNILATRDVGTVQAGVQVTGTAEAPVVTLYSQPAMPERDILGYIFMGRPMRAGQEGEDALMIGAGALMPGYGGTFSDLGISEIDIQGLFTGAGGVSVRKRLSEEWEIESTLGIESGVDLFYLIKFD